jgi:hypothetical protein
MSIVNKIQRLEQELLKHKKRLDRWRGHRLSLGLCLFFMLIGSQIFPGYYLELLALLGITPLFVFYVAKTRRLQSFVEQLEHLHLFYGQQRSMAQGNFTQVTPPEQMTHPDLARDLDLGTLYPALNFCFSREGEKLLDQWLCQELDLGQREKRQNQIQQLLLYPGLLRRLHCLSLHSSQPKTRFQLIADEVNRSFFPEPILWKWLVPSSWLLLLVALLASLPSGLVQILFFIYLASMLSYVARTKHLFSRLQDLQTDFEGLSENIRILEKIAGRIDFAPELAKNQASQDIKKMDRWISLTSLRTNPILFYLLNLLLPWDFILSELCEKARQSFASHFSLWHQEAIQIEALSCLANLKIYHPTHWAEVRPDGFLLCEDLFHPLLNQESVVKNHFHGKEERIIILTGSNMSGKSTFLRAIGINVLLANIGAPVFAQRFCYQPRRLVTCIRVSDSLRDGQSYFYAEVRRMRQILETAKTQPILFLIDEPLRGTNNKERLIGNTSYLKQVIATQGAGFLCTHDLELTQLSEVAPQVANYHFGESWQDTELYFDYKIKSGPSQSTNALKILAREGLYPQSEVSN